MIDGLEPGFSFWQWVAIGSVIVGILGFLFFAGVGVSVMVHWLIRRWIKR